MKVRKVFGTETTDYLDGFQYTNSVLKFFPTAEGYFNVETGKYVYNYTDHLGNTRLSYAKNGVGLEIIEESNYYPFGLKHEGYNVLTGNSLYKYKYNGKELQETGMYDYGARFYMPDLGRWGVVDPLAEKMTRYSPYNYAFNNPLSFIDPDGREGTGWGLKDGKWNFVAGMQEGDAAYQQGGYTSFTADNSVIESGSINGGDFAPVYLGSSANDVAYAERNFTEWNGVHGGEYGNQMEAYRAWQSDPGYHKGEGFWDRTFRTIGYSTMEARRDFASGGMNMYGGYGRAAKALGAAEESGSSISKILTSTSEFDPAVTLFRGTTGSESTSSMLFLTDDAAVATSSIKNGGQLMKYDISSSGIYQLKYTGKLDVYKGIHQGSNQISTEYKFMGKDVVNALNKLGKPHP